MSRRLGLSAKSRSEADSLSIVVEEEHQWIRLSN